MPDPKNARPGWGFTVNQGYVVEKRALKTRDGSSVWAYAMTVEALGRTGDVRITEEQFKDDRIFAGAQVNIIGRVRDSSYKAGMTELHAEVIESQEPKRATG